ncbi:Nuf2 domain-containing protein [Heracleum sosnowskyi]|uniref:Nuf2 domain-containing protein n=1 Tax=Heracleum sosnowskyi TaxID=360622 RepID=A0AAD8HX18_9APIA|nr:Nuf2 domain-containing protein [Heracleum sosnowskyi]
MSKLEYPRLQRNEIVSVLAEYQIANISDSDLLHPNSDFISNLYRHILYYLDLLQEDDGQINFEALQQFENPESHLEAIQKMSLLQKIRGFVDAVHCPRKFHLKDLVKPDSDRTEFFLSAMLNFVLYRATKLDILSPIVDEMTMIDEQRKELEAKILELNAEIEEYNKARESEVSLVQEVEAKVKELRQTIPGLNNHQMSLKASIKKMKENAKEMDEKQISSAEFALVQSVQENANLRSKIVQSPDKLQRALEERKAILAEAKNAERSAMLSFQEKTSTCEVNSKISNLASYDTLRSGLELDLYVGSSLINTYVKCGNVKEGRKAYERMSKHFAQMRDLQEQVNSAKAIEKEVKVLKSKLTEEGVLDMSLEAKLVERQGKADQLNELKKQLEKERELNCEAATKELTNVKLEVESRKHGNESRQRNVEALLTEVDAIEAKIKLAKDSSAAKQQELGLKCEEIVKQFYQYKNRLEDSWASFEVRP